jgi:threonine synthase
MIGVQSEGCSPIADTYEKGLERVERFDRPVTLDHVLENPAPASGNELVRKIRKHGGVLLKVRNAEIIEAALKLAREGIFAQPASATALAGVVQCLRCGRIPVDARVVSIVTGSGLKYPSIVQSYSLSVNETPLDEVTSVLERLAASSPVSSSAKGASRV